ncbi:MAG: hypothetical protein EXS35_17425 [Pedosphaera sp.]|nr:hypothetical protein [Pedosphaera sp.]
MKLLALFAVVGLIVSALLHLVTFTGVDCSGFSALIFPLGAGVFVVWIPTVFASKNLQSDKQKDFWKVALARFPKWLPKVLGVLAAYMIFNFIFTIVVLKHGGGPRIVNGEKILQSHGQFIKKLTDEEYVAQKGYDLRIVTGHTMMFYCAAALVLSARARQAKSRKLKAEN